MGGNLECGDRTSTPDWLFHFQLDFEYRENVTAYRQKLVPTKPTHSATLATPEVGKKINSRVNPSVENPKSIKKNSVFQSPQFGRVVNKVLDLYSQKKIF